MLLLALIPVRAMKGSTDSLRLAVGLSGLWWALFSLPAAAWLPGASSTSSPGATILEESDLDVTATRLVQEEDWRMSREIVRAWKRLGQMLKWREIKRLRNTFVYLAAWFLLSDGFTTITSTALLFAKTTLHMSASSLILIGALTPSAGIAGSLAWPALQRRLGWSNLKVLVVLVTMASAIPAYGCLGFLSVFQKSNIKFGGLTTSGEMYVLAVYFVSAIQRICRSGVDETRSGLGVWRIPGLRPSVLRGVHPAWRRGKVVCALLYHRQGTFYLSPGKRRLMYVGSTCSLARSSARWS